MKEDKNNFKETEFNDGLMVTEISKSKRIPNVDKELIINMEKSKKKRVVVKDFFSSDSERLKEVMENTDKFVLHERIKYEVGFDKLECSIEPSLSLEEFLKYNGISRDMLDFYTSGGQRLFKFKRLSFRTVGLLDPVVKKAVAVPTKFDGGIEECIETMQECLPQKTFDNLKIYRLDYQIVIHGMSFKEVNRRLVATRTRSIEILRLAKKELTRYFGRSPLKIALYDMKKKHGIHAIKIETRTWSKYIDVKHPTQIKDWVLSLKFNPFDQLILLNFDYSTSNKKRMIQFNALSEVLGTQFARSYLNTQSNAARDFKKVLFENAPIQLSKVWEQGLRQYFNVEGGHDLKTSANEE